ncbi:Crinkler (CRN) family protein, partial [Phytophthora palmivora]
MSFEVWRAVNSDPLPNCYREFKKAQPELPKQGRRDILIRTISALARPVQSLADRVLSVIFPTDPTEPLILAVPIDGWVTANLDDVDQFTEERVLTDWEAGSVHKIPLISSFLKDLGECPTNGEIYWRLEDRLLVSFLIKCWFQESQWQEQFMEYENCRALVVGSPGIGKSVITCVLAFYIALVRKTSVVVYRKVKGKGNCLFYLGYEDQEETPGGSTQTKAVCFKATKCSMTPASIIYRSLGNKCGKQKVWLFLDGFIFHDVPAELDDFKMLATSEQADIKSNEVETTHYGLLSSWKKEDLFALGRSICGFSDDEMENRYYYSGGSVREFTLESVSDIRNTIDNAIAGVSESDELLSRKRFIHSHTSQMNRFR